MVGREKVGGGCRRKGGGGKEKEERDRERGMKCEGIY